MKLNKRTFFKVHSWIGIKLSILFFIVCFSGTIATVSHELDWLFNPEIRVPTTGTPISRNVIRDNIRSRYPAGEITYWTNPRAPYLADIVYVHQNDHRRYVFVNPYTGAIQGDAAITIQRYFRDLHYFLFIPFQIGHFTVLTFAFLLLLSVVTALIFYKKWYRKLFVLKTGKGLLVLLRSLHRLMGLWSIPFALLFAVTGIWYFIERANVGGVSRYIRYQVPKVVKNEAAWEGLTYTVDYDKVIQIAQKKIPGLVIENIGPPSSVGNPVYVYGSNHIPLVRPRANRVYLDPFNYEVLAVQNAKDINTQTWLNDIADPLHFGYWGGLTTKLVWFAFGIGISSLVLSGIWIAIKRKIKQRYAEQERIIGPWKYLNHSITLGMFFFMYHALIVRYAVAWQVTAAITLCWLLLILLTWWIYVWRMNAINQLP